MPFHSVMTSPTASCPDERGSSHLERQPATKDPASVFSDELMLDIFSRLDLSSLGTSRQVCRNWNRIATNESLWRNVICREIAFSNRDWARCFGPEVVAHEDNREESTSLPWREYIEDSRKFYDLFPEKSGKDYLMLVRLPKTLTATRNEEGELVGGLTLKSLGQLAKEKYFPKNEHGYRSMGMGL